MKQHLLIGLASLLMTALNLTLMPLSMMNPAADRPASTEQRIAE